MPPLLIFIILSFQSLSRAEDRPHGLANENALAPIYPQAYEFFNPYTNVTPPTKAKQLHSSNCKTLPLAATVKSTPAQESIAWSAHRGLGAGGIAAVSLSFILICIIGIGVYYVMIKQRANLRRANAKQPVDI
ncbi:hypothetical protein PHJA_000393500 [Phtheirospermum japonicum]|uniref:Uncharacterized protein n=1 Tax=Phtheirospermum japonicum TaxID=374723 RepID=A0A830BEW2_9LAMI|nr:hypothetical protein PHJA_000393500 [Phtheirospermum japonicum]